jgi:hypothetical protein
MIVLFYDFVGGFVSAIADTVSNFKDQSFYAGL